MHQKNIIISLAQCPITDGDISGNLKEHLSYIKASAEQGADLVVFAELSLNGYSLEHATDDARSQKDNIFNTISQYAAQHKITVVAGALLTSSTTKPYIGAVICHVDGSIDFYHKQYLHAGEARYITAGHQNYRLQLKGFNIALAICADFSRAEHVNDANKDHVDLYIASALISKKGFSVDADILQGIARQLNIPVLLANHISATAGWDTCGNNGVWTGRGDYLHCDNHQQACLVIANICKDSITLKMHAFDS